MRYSSDGPRLPLVLRVVVVAAMVTAMVIGIRWAGSAYHDTVALRHAHDCPAGTPPSPDPGCTVPESGVIGAKSTGESCTTDSDGDQSCSTYYRVEVRRAGRTDTLDIGKDTYGDVHRGDAAHLRTWHGEVVRMAVDGHTDRFGPSSEGSLDWRLEVLWVLLGLGIWAAISGYPRSLFAFHNFGWLWLAFPVSRIVHDILLGAGVFSWIVSIAFAGFGVFWMVFAAGLGSYGFGRSWSKRYRRRNRAGASAR
jgi:hypothetical protein